MKCPRCDKEMVTQIGANRFCCRLCTNEWEQKPKEAKALAWETPDWAKDHKGPARLPNKRFDDRKPLPDIDVDLDFGFGPPRAQVRAAARVELLHELEDAVIAQIKGIEHQLAPSIAVYGPGFKHLVGGRDQLMLVLDLLRAKIKGGG